MDSWGSRMVLVAETVARMAAVGLGLEPTAITDLMTKVGPTGGRKR